MAIPKTSNENEVKSGLGKILTGKAGRKIRRVTRRKTDRKKGLISDTPAHLQ